MNARDKEKIKVLISEAMVWAGLDDDCDDKGAIKKATRAWNNGRVL